MTARVWFLLIFLSLLWGGSFFFIGVAVREVPVATLAGARVTFASVFLLAALFLSGLRPPRDLATWRSFFIIGLLNSVIPFYLIVWAQTQIGSGLAAILNAFTPISTAIVAHVFTTDEKLTPPRLVGVLLGFGGVAVMLGPDLIQGLDAHLLPPFAVLLATVSYGFAAVYGRRFSRLKMPPMMAASGQILAASMMLVPLALVLDRPWQLALPSGTVIAAVLAMAMFSTALAYVVFFRVLAQAGSNANLVTLLVPVSAILLGALFLGERLGPRHFAGMAIIAAGLIAIDGRLFRYLQHRSSQGLGPSEGLGGPPSASS